MDLSLRKKAILKEVIDTFIATGEPVGSKAVMSALRPACSSATIRNEMNDLEKLGLLEQPHTSAGRIPTTRGYRLYVDSLMEECTPTFEETLLLQSLLSNQIRETDQILSDMTTLLAKMTGYAVVCFMGESLGTIERFEGVFVNPGSFLLVLITSSGKAVTKQLNVEIPLNPEAVCFIIKALNDHLAKKELGAVTLERIIAMEKELGDYKILIAPLLQVIYDIVAQMGEESVLVKGISNLLSYPEFQEGGIVSDLLAQLEDEDLLLARFRQNATDHIRVHIATGGVGLDLASVITCPFRLRHNLKGTVCIIGPKRMNYSKAMAKLEYLSKQINAVHGFEPKIPLIETKE